MSDTVASAAGGQLCSFRVWVVMGPMEMAGTLANGKVMLACFATAARWMTLEELVKVAASIPCSNASRSWAGAESGMALR